MAVDTAYTFTRSGRSWGTVIAVLFVWSLVLIAWTVFEAAGWIVVTVLLFTLPAMWDLYSGRAAGMSLTDQGLAWHSGRHAHDLKWAEIEHVRLDTRLDFTVRASAVLPSGRKVRLPQDATPPHKKLEAELAARGIKTERHHFSLLG